MKHIKLLNDEGIICCKVCESVNNGYLEKHHDHSHNKIMVKSQQLDLVNLINFLKTIIQCKDEIIKELRENNQSLKDKINLMEQLKQMVLSDNNKPNQTKNEEEPIIITESVVMSENNEDHFDILNNQNNKSVNNENKTEMDNDVKKSWSSVARKTKKAPVILGKNNTEGVAVYIKAWLFVSRYETTYNEY